MTTQLQLLTPEIVDQIFNEAFQLLENHGVRVQSAEARALLAEAGARVDENREVAHLHEGLIRQALASVPHEFYLYDRAGEPAVHYGGDSVHFDPGSSCVNVLDPETLEHYPAQTA
ncbi:MAG TPA: hypothetical protein DEH25_18530, partial [Chloroflexi bacterium]|nr:hypothetical protein [Chloroflexota bacterium]